MTHEVILKYEVKIKVKTQGHKTPYLAIEEMDEWFKGNLENAIFVLPPQSLSDCPVELGTSSVELIESDAKEGE